MWLQVVFANISANSWWILLQHGSFWSSCARENSVNRVPCPSVQLTEVGNAADDAAEPNRTDGSSEFVTRCVTLYVLQLSDLYSRLISIKRSWNLKPKIIDLELTWGPPPWPWPLPRARPAWSRARARGSSWSGRTPPPSPGCAGRSPASPGADTWAETKVSRVTWHRVLFGFNFSI